MTETKVIAKSPCLGDCNPNDDGVCLSCFLTIKENDQWNHISNEERLAILENAQQRQKAKSEGRPMIEIGSGEP